MEPVILFFGGGQKLRDYPAEGRELIDGGRWLLIGTVLFLHVFPFFNRGKNTKKETTKYPSIISGMSMCLNMVWCHQETNHLEVWRFFWRRPVRSPKEVHRLLLEALSHFQLRQEVHIMRRYGPPHPFLLAMRSQWRPGLSGPFTFF